jgi:hypothetical protein
VWLRLATLERFPALGSALVSQFRGLLPVALLPASALLCLLFLPLAFALTFPKRRSLSSSTRHACSSKIGSEAPGSGRADA